jgi:hypothetical protein
METEYTEQSIHNNKHNNENTYPTEINKSVQNLQTHTQLKNQTNTTTPQRLATLHHTSPKYTSLRSSTLHFLSFDFTTLSLGLTHLRTFPTALFHFTSLN